MPHFPKQLPTAIEFKLSLACANNADCMPGKETFELYSFSL